MSLLNISNEQIQSRHEEKLKTTVTFLKQEGYSDFQTISLLLGYTAGSRAAVYRILNKLTAQGLVHKHDVAFLDGEIKKTLWGITELGLGQYIQEDDEDYPAFDPYRVKFVTLEHKLMTQKIRIYLERKGWTHWQNADAYAFRESFPLEHRPDAVVTAPQGFKIAIETERSIKNPARYRAIIKSHILAKQQKWWDAVYYIVPDSGFKKVLSKRFDRVEYVQFDESRHPLDSYRKDFIGIFTLEDIKGARPAS